MQPRQRLRDIVDRLERVQRTGTGIAHFIEAGADRRLDILAAPGSGVALPFTPGRDHCRVLAIEKSPIICINPFSSKAPFALKSEYMERTLLSALPTPAA